MYRNPRPLTRRKAVNLIIALLLLAWATQTLMTQLGYGAPPVERPQEKFVPGTEWFAQGATIELRSDATVIGPEVRLRQIGRWSDRDNAVLAPLGDLVLFRLGEGAPFRVISVPEIKQILRDAGVNVAPLNFVGAMNCTVARSDVEFDQGAALEAMMRTQARQATPPPVAPTPDTASAFVNVDAALPQPVPPAPPAQSRFVHGDQAIAAGFEPVPGVRAPIDHSPVRTLRQLIQQEHALRLGVAPEALQISYRTQDEKLLNLSEPQFRFSIEPRGSRLLGDVQWTVTVSGEGASDRFTVVGHARAWQTQLVLTRPVAHRQIITETDVIERRTLVDDWGADMPLSREQAMGLQASRDLRAGTVLTARMVESPQYVRAGQLVTVTMEQGGVRIRTVARATEAGVLGQTIRVRNDTTRQTLQVVVTGPQTAALVTAGNAVVGAETGTVGQ